MTLRIIPGAVSTTSLRALVISDESTPPKLALTDLRGGACPTLKIGAHGSGDVRFDQHVNGAGLRLYLAEASGLKPGTDYQLGDAHMRTFPRQLGSDGVRIALASCFSDQFKRDGDYLRVLQGAAGGGPLAAKLLVGDNLYVDVGPASRTARSPFEETADRYLQYFWRSSYARVLAYLPSFMLWDDHEFWNNYPEQQVWLPRSLGAAARDYGAAALAGIKAFQAVLNPAPAAAKGLSYKFAIPPLSCFALDLRAGRTRQGAARPAMCSEAELLAFEAWARGLEGPGALVVGQPLWQSPGDWQDWNPPAFAAQNARIWRALTDAPWDIVVISGDVHHSHLIEIDVGPGRRVWELVSSPACHIPTIESIASRAFDTQPGHGGASVVPTLAVTGVAPRLHAYHMGTGCPNSIALLHLTQIAGGGVRFAGSFIDLVRKTPAAGFTPANGIPVAPGDHAWCKRDPMFELHRRPEL
jgi:hypothetical protein